MHIIIAVITAVAGLLIALNRLQQAGVDLERFNPFYWARRRAWAQQQVDPLYAIETPRELCAVLMLAIMRRSGELTSDEKQALLALWEEELKFSAAAANDMYGVASFLLGSDPNHADRIEDVMRPSLASISDAQRASLAELAQRVADLDPAAAQARAPLAAQVQRVLERHQPH